MKKYFTAGDVLLAAIICFLCISGLVFSFFPAEEKGSIVIEVDGKVYSSYDMKSLGEKTQEINITTEYGKNTLSINCEGAKMIYSDCPQQIDVKTGKITKPGETIVCVPHRLVVYIKRKTDIDAISN